MLAVALKGLGFVTRPDETHFGAALLYGVVSHELKARLKACWEQKNPQFRLEVRGVLVHLLTEDSSWRQLLELSSVFLSWPMAFPDLASDLFTKHPDLINHVHKTSAVTVLRYFPQHAQNVKKELVYDLLTRSLVTSPDKAIQALLEQTSPTGRIRLATRKRPAPPDEENSKRAKIE